MKKWIMFGAVLVILAFVVGSYFYTNGYVKRYC
jgi:hypothetical protein